MSQSSILQSSANTEGYIEWIALIIAPGLFAISTFFWVNGEYSVVSSTLMILSLFFWLFAFRFLFRMTSQTLSRYSVWGLVVAYFGCISGICFAFLGYLTTILKVPHATYLEALNNYPLSSQMLLFATGPLFPLSILILGIQLMRKKIVPFSAALLLCIAGATFPLGRILRDELLAHVTDLTLLSSCVLIASKRYRPY